MLTISQYAKRYNTPRPTVINWVHEGRVICQKHDGRWLIQDTPPTHWPRTDGLKQCTMCYRVLPEDEYGLRNQAHPEQGVRAWCRRCHRDAATRRLAKRSGDDALVYVIDHDRKVMRDLSELPDTMRAKRERKIILHTQRIEAELLRNPDENNTPGGLDTGRSVDKVVSMKPTQLANEVLISLPRHPTVASIAALSEDLHVTRDRIETALRRIAKQGYTLHRYGMDGVSVAQHDWNRARREGQAYWEAQRQDVGGGVS